MKKTFPTGYQAAEFDRSGPGPGRPLEARVGRAELGELKGGVRIQTGSGARQKVYRLPSQEALRPLGDGSRRIEGRSCARPNGQEIVDDGGAASQARHGAKVDDAARGPVEVRRKTCGGQVRILATAGGSRCLAEDSRLAGFQHHSGSRGGGRRDRAGGRTQAELAQVRRRFQALHGPNGGGMAKIEERRNRAMINFGGRDSRVVPSEGGRPTGQGAVGVNCRITGASSRAFADQNSSGPDGGETGW